MKKVILFLALLTCPLLAVAQKGISYQAIILDPNPIEIPGQDITGQPFVNGAVSLKFRIYSANLVQEFEEVHSTQTDAFGTVNVLIGSVSTGAFSSLVWDSNQKSLHVLVSFDQGGTYTKVSEQQLTYNPMALFAETAGKLSETLSIAGGGTGATTAAAARTNLGLGNVDNTSDANKPISSATQTALDTKANENEVTTALATKANAAEVTSSLNLKANANEVNTALATKANAAEVTSALATKANASDVSVSLALKEDVSNKANTPLGSSTTLYPTQNAVKTYVDAQVASATIADANGSTKGKIQLAGDLSGTAAAPTVPGLALKANTSDVTTSLATKVDKVTGKDLSTNDYTTADKNKLAAITGTNTGDQDLSSLATNAALGLKANTSDVTTSLATKVDKVTGKDLSSNDYTTAEKDKLAAITGTNTGDQLNISGNAATATKLATAKNINGVAFDGSADITVTADAGTLTGTTLASNVVNSSLTSVGTLTSGTINLTTDIVTSGNLKAGDITYPNTAGTDGQVLTSTGSGTLTWTTPSSGSGGTHTIGELYGGGIVFYVTADGLHGLIAETVDQSSNNSMGMWYNAQDIISTSSSHSSEGALFTDWRLPTKNELSLMRRNIGQGAPSPNTNKGGFQGGLYLSSTESPPEQDQFFVWGIYFYDGFAERVNKEYPLVVVRAIRAF
jgi:hypothetical protein